MITSENGAQIKLYAGLYLRTQRQTRFWGWSNWGWRKLRAIEAERPWAGLASWLRQAHARWDGIPALLPAPSEPGIAPAPAQLLPERGEPQRRKRGKLQFVCNRHLIGLLLVDDDQGGM